MLPHFKINIYRQSIHKIIFDNHWATTQRSVHVYGYIYRYMLYMYCYVCALNLTKFIFVDKIYFLALLTEIFVSLRETFANIRVTFIDDCF